MMSERSANDPARFVFDEAAAAAFEPALDIGDRWKELPHAETRTRAFVMIPGEVVWSPAHPVGDDDVLVLVAMPAAAGLSADGLELTVVARQGDEQRTLAVLPFGPWQSADSATRLDLSLASLRGRDVQFGLRCLPGPENDPRGDWIGVVHWVVCRSDACGLALALSHHRWRMDNELSHFGDADRSADAPADNGAPARARSDAAPTRPVVEAVPRVETPDATGSDATEEDGMLAGCRQRLADIEPRPGESVFEFGHRLLYALLPRPIPDFPGHLRQIAADRTPRLLSLCAGEARVEDWLLTRAGVDADLTLLDINADLLTRASERFVDRGSLRLWRGDVDEIGVDAGRFDVILFVSGLHHVVELEKTLAAAARLLVPGGEFWLIGEQVGRNGNRLWPAALDAANAAFAALPDGFRRNRYTGRIDTRVPNPDLSLSSFEGIRSQEIPDLLARYFLPIEEHRCDCFLWRLIDPAYAENYRLDEPESLDALRRLVLAEFGFWRRQGAGVQLNGRYHAR
ncbi:MAG: class I SAM-dependent methyltransferase [Xanthomonadaceae bacterium]|nr:class I SAM-dependent methyltransferase [Xanthomonadaceae bacterium]